MWFMDSSDDRERLPGHCDDVNPTSRADGYRRAGSITTTVVLLAVGVPLAGAVVAAAEHSHFLSGLSRALHNGGGLSSGGGSSHAVSSGS